MEYVPLNIKQEPTPLQRSESTVNGSTSSINQAAPDSVENKVSKTYIHTHTHKFNSWEKEMRNYLKTQKMPSYHFLLLMIIIIVIIIVGVDDFLCGNTLS